MEIVKKIVKKKLTHKLKVKKENSSEHLINIKVEVNNLFI